MSYIVHADNSEFFRKLMKHFLAEIGLESEGFERGEEAINAVNSGKASCIITGLALADMSGEEFIKRLVGASRQVPIIAVTSNEEENQAKRLSALGVKATILKSGDWKNELRQLLT
jgi:CheY-like chemotaxis protein